MTNLEVFFIYFIELLANLFRFFWLILKKYVYLCADKD